MVSFQFAMLNYQRVYIYICNRDKYGGYLMINIRDYLRGSLCEPVEYLGYSTNILPFSENVWMYLGLYKKLGISQFIELGSPCGFYTFLGSWGTPFYSSQMRSGRWRLDGFVLQLRGPCGRPCFGLIRKLQILHSDVWNGLPDQKLAHCFMFPDFA